MQVPSGVNCEGKSSGSANTDVHTNERLPRMYINENVFEVLEISLTMHPWFPTQLWAPVQKLRRGI